MPLNFWHVFSNGQAINKKHFRNTSEIHVIVLDIDCVTRVRAAEISVPDPHCVCHWEHEQDQKGARTFATFQLTHCERLELNPARDLDKRIEIIRKTFFLTHFFSKLL
jgi:hypothetical protein